MKCPKIECGACTNPRGLRASLRLATWTLRINKKRYAQERMAMERSN